MTEEELERMERTLARAGLLSQRDELGLIAEVRRLQGLITQAEWRSGSQGEPRCPWCFADALTHKADCPAFPPV